jgi:YD repeat-containing protein
MKSKSVSGAGKIFSLSFLINSLLAAALSRLRARARQTGQRSPAQTNPGIWGKGFLIGALLMVLFLASSGLGGVPGSVERVGELSTVASQRPGCSATPNVGQQGETIQVVIRLDSRVIPLSILQILFQILQMNPQAVVNATTLTFQPPEGIVARVLEVSISQSSLNIRASLEIDPSAPEGLRNMTLEIAPIPPLLPSPIRVNCPEAFTVVAGVPRTFFNGPPIFTTSWRENATKPACGCSGEPTYSQGIGLVTGACPKCETVGMFPGILQDTGPRGTVFLHNGEFFHYEVDLEIPGRGFNWKFERKYRSGIIFDGPLGHNWEFNYNRRLFVEDGGSVIRMDGYGRADRYELTGGGYTAPTGFYTRLIRNPDGTFTERDRNGTTVTYSRPDATGIARMMSVTDRNGNTMRFVYNRAGQLTQVLDTLGRPIDYRYNRDGRLVEVRDFFNRSIKFEYDANGDLVAVTSPAVIGTPNGNDFPQGKTTRYSYLSGIDEQLKHNLVSITAPNEVAVGGPPRVEVEYDAFDRVIRQTIGGVNQSGVPAGGTIRYEYRFLGTAPANDFNRAVLQTTVTDRNGNLTEYQFNQLGNIVRIREFTNRNIRPGDPEFFETRYEYNKEGELLRQINPQGNTVEYVYDDRNPDRFQQGNLLGEMRRPDSKRGGDQTLIRITYTYEPIYNQVRTVTEARGNDPSYVPPNGGTNTPERYTTVYIFDYQEGTNFAGLARALGVTVFEVQNLLRRANIPMGLGDLNGDGRTDQIAGNVVEVIRPTVNLLPDSNMARIEGSTRQPIEETYTYNRFGQMTSRRDPEGNITLYEYYPENDPDGDGRDLTPGVSNAPFGYLKAEIRDAVSSPERNSGTNPRPAEIRRQYFYDRVGNVIGELDGRGILTEYVVNQLNQVVQIIRAADVSEALRNPEEPNFSGCADSTLVECRAGMVPFRYLTNIFFDFNNNVIRREIENRDSNNKELAGDWITYEFKYDILDNLIEETQEVSENPREILVTKYRYDRNENRVLEISPVANLPAGHPERQPSNVVSYVFDERDLLFTSTRGGLTDQFKALAAHADIPELRTIPNSRDISTFTRVYDLNRNLIAFIDGADNTGDGQPEVTTYLYDGFDRQVSVIDAVGNQNFTNYDPAGNVVRVSQFGPVGGPSPRSNAAATFTQPLTLRSFRQPLLSQVEYKYDELGRMFERNDQLFVYNGVTYVRTPVPRDGPLGAANDGIVVTRYEYDRKSRRTFLIEDDLSTFQTFYDGVDRVIREIDPELNEVLYTYDDNNNTVKVVEIEITQRSDVAAGKVPDLKETFTTINVYDSLNRLIRTTDNLGQTSRSHYDSRDNLIFTSDAQHSKDNAELIADPLGLFPSAGQDSRGVTRINKPGNTMEYFYDGINRKISEVRHLRVDGQGKNPIDTSNPANPDGLIVIDYDWDANSRLVLLCYKIIR